MKAKEKEKIEAYEHLKQYRGKEVAVVINSVSRSGMSRRMEFYADGFNRIGYSIAKFLDYPYNDKGIRVDGCGMDMVFHILSNLNYAMAQRDTGKTIKELLKTGECGKHIYDVYFFNANNYRTL